MIARYSLPDMEAIWTLENKFRRWLDIEIYACEAWAELGVIPREDVELSLIHIYSMESASRVPWFLPVWTERRKSRSFNAGPHRWDKSPGGEVSYEKLPTRA